MYRKISILCKKGLLQTLIGSQHRTTTWFLQTLNIYKGAYRTRDHIILFYNNSVSNSSMDTSYRQRWGCSIYSTKAQHLLQLLHSKEKSCRTEYIGRWLDQNKSSNIQYTEKKKANSKWLLKSRVMLQLLVIHSSLGVQGRSISVHLIITDENIFRKKSVPSVQESSWTQSTLNK